MGLRLPGTAQAFFPGLGQEVQEPKGLFFDAVSGATKPAPPQPQPQPQAPLPEGKKKVAKPLPPKPEANAAEKVQEEDFDPAAFDAQTIADSTGEDIGEISKVQEDANREPFSISELQNLIGQGMQSQGLNLSSLGALVDSETGSNFRAAFANTDSPSRRRDKILKQISGVVQMQQKQDQFNAAAKLSLLKAGQQKVESPGSFKRRRDSFEKELRKQFGKFDDEIATNEGRLSQIRSALETGSLPRIRFVLANMVREIGGERGTLAEGDIRRALHPTFEDMFKGIEIFFGADGKLKDGVKLSSARLRDLKTIVANATQKNTILAKQRVGSYTERTKLSSVAKEMGTNVDSFAKATIGNIGKKVKLHNTPTGKPINDKFSKMTRQQKIDLIRKHQSGR